MKEQATPKRAEEAERRELGEHPSVSRRARPEGISAFVRCKNEEEFIVASLMSAYRVFDEMVVILNNSTDRTRELVQDLMTDHPKIRLLDYDMECAPAGPGYLELVANFPDGSLARYYNWCLEHTTYSHVCKWDGDMIALPTISQVRDLINANDLIMFDGYDAMGEYTTDMEPRIFRYDPARANYVDWELYEVLMHDYGKIARVDPKCYLHMKLVKKEWVHKQWVCPNDFASESVPHTGAAALDAGRSRWIRDMSRRILRRLGLPSGRPNNAGKQV